MIFVGVGGVLGAITRYLLGRWITSKTSIKYPIGTWLINISGSLFLGIIITIYINNPLEWVWLLLGIGFLGSYTTFSTFGYEIFQLLQQGSRGSTITYVVTSIVLGVMFAFAGVLIGGLFI